MVNVRETAEMLALDVLGWLVGNEELLPVFLGSTGASEGDLRSQAAEPAFLAAVLDFLMMDDAWVIAYCDQAQRRYETIMQARQALPGGAQTNWT